jgi:hypothetical protein
MFYILAMTDVLMLCMPRTHSTRQLCCNRNDTKQGFKVKVHGKIESFFNMYCDVSYLRGLLARLSPQRPRFNPNVKYVEYIALLGRIYLKNFDISHHVSLHQCFPFIRAGII